MITVYGRHDSSNCAKVFWLLDELKADYSLQLAGGKHGGTDTPEYRAMQPFGKVPALAVDGVGLFESQAILRYIGAMHPSDLWPADPLAHARIDGWMDWLTTALVPPLGAYRKAKGDRYVELSALTQAFRTFDKVLSMSGGYIAGDHLTLADICAAPAVHRWFLIDDPKPELPALKDYLATLQSYQGYKTHIEAVLS